MHVGSFTSLFSLPVGYSSLPVVSPRDHDLGTQAHLALDVQGRTDGLGALAHHGQAKVAGWDCTQVETLPIVDDLQFGPTSALNPQPYAYRARFGVLRS